MDAPSASDIRLWSDVGFAELGYGPPEENETDRLDIVIKRAITELESDALGGKKLETIVSDEANPQYDQRTPLIEEAIQRYVEYKCAAGQMEMLETAADYDMIQSMHAGGFSQTNRGRYTGRAALHPWPLLARILQTIRWFDSAGKPSEQAPSISVPTPDWEAARAIMRQRRYGVYDPVWVTGEFLA